MEPEGYTMGECGCLLDIMEKRVCPNMQMWHLWKREVP